MRGFTLIEISIVLVIIGLLVGGVLVGRDMIHAAEIRATIGQWEKYNTALNTFRTKYNCLPGDCANAANFGFVAATSGTGVVPDDGLLQTSAGGGDVSTAALGLETSLFWQHLSVAGLIPNSLTAAGAGLAANLTSATINGYLPTAKIGGGNYWTVFNTSGRNYYEITGVTSTSPTGRYTLSPNLTPLDSFAFDGKVDDGAPTTGIVQGKQGTNVLNIITPFAQPDQNCVTTISPAQYNTAVAPNNLLCQLRLNMN